MKVLFGAIPRTAHFSGVHEAAFLDTLKNSSFSFGSYWSLNNFNETFPTVPLYVVPLYYPSAYVLLNSQSLFSASQEIPQSQVVSTLFGTNTFSKFRS